MKASSSGFVLSGTLSRDEMKTVLVRWPLALVITATSSISAVVQLDGQSICGKRAGYSQAAVPNDTTLTGGGHTTLVHRAEHCARKCQSECLVRFKDLSQCIAAMHVAKNLNLSFGDLQSKMTGSTSMHLDKAIQSFTGQEVNAKNGA